jgi:DNA-binding transcriptional LysR family regulator
MRVFVAVVEAQGFSAASRVLGMPVATVSRRIGELERHLGARLLLRTTRRVAVTESGQRYYENVRRIIESVAHAERLVSGEDERVAGLLTITAPVLFGQLHLSPIVNQFLGMHPDIRIRLIFTNHVLDLVDEQIDLAVRIGGVADNATSSTPVGNIRLIVCASPAYLRANGTPTAPEEIARHPCITFSRKGTPYPWPFRMPSGQVREINVRPRLLVNSAQSAVQAALEGVGLTQLYSYQAARPVASGELIIVLRAFEPDPVPVTINAIGQSPMPLKVKAFAEFARLKLSERLAAIQSIGEI